jgi:signal transduction histidine kinase
MLNKLFKKHTLFQQILIAGISPALLVFSSLFTYSLITRLNDVAISQREIATRIAENIAASSELAIISGNDAQLFDIIRSALAKDITAITVTNALSGKKTSVKSSYQSSESVELLSVPIFQSNIEISDAITGNVSNNFDSPKIIGTVTIEQSKVQLARLQRKIILVSSSIGAISIFLCIILAWVVSRRLSKPFAEINIFTKNIAAGRLGSRLNVEKQGELGELQSHINEMAKSIEAQQRELTNRLAQLELAKTEADAANNAKSLFLATMTHELRTPMNGALGMLQLLSTTSLNQEQNNYIEIAKSSSEHLLNIVNNILDFSKIEKGDLKLEKRHFPPASLLDSLLTPLAYDAKNKGISFNYSVAPELNTINIYADDTRIRQIILNLASNAVKFTHDGGVTITLCGEKLKHQQQRLTLLVADTGIGIAPSNHEIIFDSFRQADSSNQRRYGGSGLGLAIVKRLCKAMDADIEMISTPGEGTQFKVNWVCDYEYQNTAISADAPQNILSGKKILIVEDNPINQMLVTNIVKRWNMTAITANNGVECLNELQRQSIDIVLMDLQMPIMDGYEASKQIRLNPEFATLPIIALTANNFQEDKDRCFDVGMNDFLSKPVSLNILKEKISAWLSV